MYDLLITALLSFVLRPISYAIVGDICFSSGVEDRRAMSLLFWITQSFLFITSVIIIGFIFQAALSLQNL